MNEQPRPDANADEQAYTLTVEEAAARYEAAGHARTMRAIQKYCARGDLTCIREQTTYGERFRIPPASVTRHIEQIEQLSQAHVREQSRPDAADVRYVVQLESENAFLRDQINRKDHQIEARDGQIEAMIERDRETNILIEQLQRRIPMLPQPERRGEEARPMAHTDIPDEAAAEGRG